MAIKCNPEYVAEMLAFTQTLKGRELNEREQEVLQVAIKTDPYLYFTVYGIQPETQRYIDYTLLLLRECKSLADEAICEMWVQFSAESLGIPLPAGSRLETAWNGYLKWKAKQDSENQGADQDAH